MTRRDLWVFLLLLVTAPRAAVAAWKQFKSTKALMVGYKGASAYEAGYFYAPYIPLQVVRPVNAGAYEPKIKFKTRYGDSPSTFNGVLNGRFKVYQDPYFRKVKIG